MPPDSSIHSSETEFLSPCASGHWLGSASFRSLREKFLCRTRAAIIARPMRSASLPCFGPRRKFGGCCLCHARCGNHCCFFWEALPGSRGTSSGKRDSPFTSRFLGLNFARNDQLLVLSHYQHFADVIAGEEKLDGSEIAEEVFDVPVIEHALQAEAAVDGGVGYAGGAFAHFPAGFNVLHLQRIGAHNMV